MVFVVILLIIKVIILNHQVVRLVLRMVGITATTDRGSAWVFNLTVGITIAVVAFVIAVVVDRTKRTFFRSLGSLFRWVVDQCRRCLGHLDPQKLFSYGTLMQPN
jgi:hypothetical protein